MRTLHVGLVSIAFSASAWALIACSSPQPTLQSGDSNDTSGTDPSMGTTPIGGSTSTPTPPPTPPGAPSTPPADVDAGGSIGTAPDSGAATPQDCSSTTTSDACYQCCDSNNPAGFQVGDDAYMAYICQTPGVCAQACASTLCSTGGADPSAQCSACLGSPSASQCDQAADQACQASPACQAADQCAQTSNCDGKQ